MIFVSTVSTPADATDATAASPLTIAIVGGHGKIARRLTSLLTAQGHSVLSLIRKPEQIAAIQKLGAEPVLVDLETCGCQGLGLAFHGADVVVFAAGAGPGSGKARKVTVDRNAAIATVKAAVKAQVPRFLMISSIGAGQPQDHQEEVFQAYLVAKGEADEFLTAQKDIDWTVLRPGRLTDDEQAGTVKLSQKEPESRSVPRQAVAEVIAHMINAEPSAFAKKTYWLVSGEDRIDELTGGA